MNKLLKVSMFSVFALVLLFSATSVFAARSYQRDAETSDGNSRTGAVSYITASPSNVILGDSSVISWDARPSGATRCWDLPSYKSMATHGKRTVSPTMTGQYGIMCEDPIDGKGYSGWVEITVAKGNVTGNISATDCTIGVGGRGCTPTINWSISNPVSVTEVITSSRNILETSNATSGTITNHGTYYPGETIYLYHDSKLIDQVTTKATCVSGSVWNGQYCKSSGLSNSQVQTQSQYQPNTATEQYRSWKSFSIPSALRSFSSWRNSYGR